MWQIWLVFLLGLWVFVSGFVPQALASPGHNMVFGFLIGLFSAWAGFRRKPFEWINFLLGVWLLISAFLFQSIWNNLAVGLVVAVLAVVDGLS